MTHPSIALDPAKLGQFTRLMFGPAIPPAKTLTEQVWEDDGGLLSRQHESYNHMIASGR